MYEKRIITRSDGSQYETFIWSAESKDLTEDQLRIQKAIDQFGTSA